VVSAAPFGVRRRVKVHLARDGAAEIKQLLREVAELRRASEILEAASVFFANGLHIVDRDGLDY